MPFEIDAVVVGGCGHVGLPLGIALADRGLRVVAFDVNAASVDQVGRGEMPFAEDGAEEVLNRVLRSGRFSATTQADVVATAENVIVVIGTPIDEYMNPDLRGVERAIAELEPRLADGQLLVLRSTVYPGTTELVERLLRARGRDVEVAFCPERIAEGRAMQELHQLPQIVSARTRSAVDRASRLFRVLADEIIELQPEEAELAKLFTNTWRYIKFATANQLYMMANDFGLDFERIRHAITHDYPRAADMPGAGFTAGPCLLKDTMQLAAFNNNNFPMGHASMLVNEGLPLYLVSRLERRFPLHDMTVGILGMSFKAESDDIRSSLSYKLKRILRFKAKDVLTTDPFVTCDPALMPLDDVLAAADLLVIGTPHKQYKSLSPTVPTVDLFHLLEGSVCV